MKRILMALSIVMGLLIGAQAAANSSDPASSPERVIGEALVFLDGERETVRTGETNLGNLVADIVRHYGDTVLGGADIGLQQAGSIRTSINEGSITVEDVMEVYTHRNWIVVVELTGAEVLEALEHSVSQYPEQFGGFLQVSGLSFSFDPSRPAGSRVVEVLVDGQSMEADHVFYVAMTNFIARGGDGFEVFGNVGMSRLQDLYVADIDSRIMNTQAIINYIEERGEIASNIEGRILVVDE